MSSLFIIGNGFDISHGLNTKYSDFKKFLSNEIRAFEEYPIDKDGCIVDIGEIELCSPRIYTSKKILIDRIEVKCVYKILDSTVKKSKIDWNNFEQLLGNLDTMSLINENSDSIEEAQSVENVISNIASYFVKWVNTIDVSSAKIENKFEKLISKDNDMFLTFNYTQLLEKCYGIEEEHVFHFHGVCEDNEQQMKLKKDTQFGKGNEPIIVGFGLEEKSVYENYKNESIRSTIKTAYLGLQKQVDDIIMKNTEFWNELKNKNIDNIYSYGFSYSDIDRDYIKKVVESLKDCGQTTRWLFNAYDNEITLKRFERIVKECGFKGGFDSF